MIGNTLSLVFRGLSIYRWNNFPRIEQVSTTDNLAFTLHTIILLAAVLEEKEGIKVDMWYIFRKIIFSSFVTLTHSDINSEVKEHLKSRPEIRNKLEDIVFQMLKDWNMPEWMERDMNEVTDRENTGYEEEKNLIAFSKLWVGYHEAYFNNEVYFGVYDRVLSSFRRKFERTEFSVYRKYLHLDRSAQGNLEKFLLSVRRLQSSYRWNRTRRIYPVSVMSHLYIIFYLTYVIGNIEGESQEEIVSMMKIALFHDIPEAITGDIVTPTKMAVPGFEEYLMEIEKSMVDEYLLIYLDGFKFKKEFEIHMLAPWSTKKGPIIKLADNFSALFEARIESFHSPEFYQIYQKIKKSLHKKPFISIDYLFKF